jgi:carboxypeptidase T
MYITDGDQIDWLYGSQRIFSFTWELFPTETGTVWGDHYTADENIARETARNRGALLYLISVAGCPYGAIGLSQQNCGPFFDDMEIGRGWTVDPDGTDTATSGRFARGDPAPTTWGGLQIQPDRASSGRYAFVTGLAAGSSPSANDLDGRTTIRSVPIALPGAPGSLTFRYTFAHGLVSAADGLRAFIEDEAGTRTPVWSRIGSWKSVGAVWTRASVPLTAWGGKTIRVVFEATDGGRDSLLEVGIDDVRVERP